MTGKQKNILTKYLNEENIKKLEKMEYEITSSFIDMILHNRWFHPVLGEMCSIPNFEKEPSKESELNIKEIERIVNEDRNKFGLLEDEYAHVDKVFYFDDEHKWYSLKQTWFKGMSESSSIRTTLIKHHHSPVESCSVCTKFDGVYNELFDMGVYSLNGLVNFFFKKAKEVNN